MADALVGRIEPVEIEEEMKSSYIDYAMSVIVGRALPDVRDGLKPVHRRILFAMYDLGMLPGRPFKKCARIVGETLGKYHPHGDLAVYDSLVRMAQDFSHRYELIEGHGNFGSIDGDPPAAMRYTEARLAKIAMELLRDIDKETVDFTANFDETLEEPTVLPSRYPNLLANGSSGIAVGMATNIPPHNLREVIDATVMLIDEPEATPQDLMKVLKGPDFPTGGTIMGKAGIKEAYATGRGATRLRGEAAVEETKGGKTKLVITEIPFQVNKAKLATKIAELVKDKKLTEISDLRDESDRDGMRLVLELKREAIPDVVLNKLYKHTQLEVTLGIIMLALVDGVPRVLSLKEILGHYIDYQKEVVTRRTRHELKGAEAKAHLLAGLLVALDNIDTVIEIIRGSREAAEAREALMKEFSLSDKQAQAILDMRLQRLTGLERQKIKDEHDGLVKRIAELKKILAEEERVLDIIKEELGRVGETFGDKRKTRIAAAAQEIDVEDLIAEEDMVITITHSGYAKRLPLTTYRRQQRGGRGVVGTALKEDDFVEHLFVSSTHHYLLLFTNQGRVYRLKVHQLPVGTRTSRGRALINLLPMRPEEKIAAVIATPSYDEDLYLCMATQNGIVKRTGLKEYDTARRDGIIAIDLRDGDELIGVKLTPGDKNILLVTREGMAIKFKESDVRAMGRTAMGVKGVTLGEGDRVLGMEIGVDGSYLLVVTEFGYGKRTTISKYPTQRRGGKGVKTLRITKARGKIAGAKVVTADHGLMLISSEGILIRIVAKSISVQNRSTQGVKVMGLKKGDRVSAIARIVTGADQEAVTKSGETV
ncbi:MAG: DNA gyrase subunit A [Terriglobia bacterium]